MTIPMILSSQVGSGQPSLGEVISVLREKTGEDYAEEVRLVSTVVDETISGHIPWQWGFTEGFHGDYVADWRDRKLKYSWLQDESPSLRVFDESGREELVTIVGSTHPATTELRQLRSIIGRQLDPDEEERRADEQREAAVRQHVLNQRQRAEVRGLLGD